MSDDSANLSLPYLAPGQAQPQVTHNEALRRLDAVVQLTVVSISETTPPPGPEDGQCYGLPAGVTGAWAGQSGQLAVFEANAWVFVTPRMGWRAWVADVAALMVWDGTAWNDAAPVPVLQNLDHLGIQTTADDTNRLAVSSAASLLTHAGAGHQVKVNKATAADTASLLFQTGWSGRAEMGTTGSDDFAVKVSADGSAWQTGFTVDAASGQVDFPQGATGLSPAAFGAGELLTTQYAIARGSDLVANGTGLLGNGYNFPANFAFDASLTPNLPGSFAYTGYSSAAEEMTELCAVDPNQVYRCSCYLMQEGVPGDWSAFTNGDRHVQYMGLAAYDADGLAIEPQHHMRFRSGGIDSLTELAAPLSPGDTSISLVSAAGWNDSINYTFNRGIVIFGYRNAGGNLYQYYSRLVEDDLFALSGVDKTSNVITLNKPLPASMANPDDPGGTWPAGTRLANCNAGGSYKYSFFSALIPGATDSWYHVRNHIGGIDTSGTNQDRNFAPGTAVVRPVWLANYSNVPGGSGNYPDTGAGTRVLFSGVSILPEALATMQTSAEGWKNLKVPVSDHGTGTISLTAPSQTVTQV